ncbi:MAG: nickel-dependent lactate racemase [Deltaproteobacteria bacterium]|nr:nickel-dependent lactate racemase [Deltaproteobacteria bacterium]MBW2137680.1 nickel-dependent lactate racemase [Deltaproteobacteria bacterium]
MKLDLLYGRDGLEVDIPDDIDVTVIRKYPMEPLPDPRRSILDALANPVESQALGTIAGTGKTVCILICDITRPVPNGIILPPLIDTLREAGVSKEDILILVATGLHRPNEGDELREIVGSEEVFNWIRIENHFARDRDAHVNLGMTSSGIPIMLDRRFVEADIKIAVGLVEPHFMAGYSGGRKVVAPGTAYQDTILMFHTAKILEHCNAANCVIQGNPLHDALIEIVRRVGGILSLNVVIDEERRIGFVNFGDIEASHLLAVDFMRKYAEVTVPRKFKVVITTSAGYPLDRTYYQTVKGMVGVIDILEPGGTIIIASECSEGMGSKEFVEAQRLLCRVGPDEFMSILHGRHKALIDEWQTEMLVKALRVGKIQLYTTKLGKDDLKDVYVEPIPSIEEALAQHIKTQGLSEIAVVPEGPYVIPLYREEG